MTTQYTVSAGCHSGQRISEYLQRIYIPPCPAYKALRHGSHSFTCKLHHACLSFVSVHQMASPLIEVADI